MPRTCRLILYISVDSLDGVTQLEPEGGWKNPFLCYHIQVDCKNCNRELLEIGYLPLYLCAGRMEDAQYHKALACPECMECGGLRILKRGGEPITEEGQEMAVMEIEVIGSFLVHKKLKLFYFKWICRKDDGSGEFVGPFSVDKDGSYAFSDSDDDELLQINSKSHHGKKRWRDSGLRWLPSHPRFVIQIRIRRIRTQILMFNSGASACFREADISP